MTWESNEVALARCRVILKRFLYQNGCHVDPDTPTTELVAMVESQSLNVPIGTYRVCWAGCAPGYGEPLYAYKPIYGLRDGPDNFPGPLVQVLIDSIVGRAWINVHPSEVDTHLTNVPTTTVYSGDTHAGRKFP